MDLKTNLLWTFCNIWFPFNSEATSNSSENDYTVNISKYLSLRQCWWFHLSQLDIKEAVSDLCGKKWWAGSTRKSRLSLSTGFKYSPTHHYCCHSQTYDDLLTLPVKKETSCWHTHSRCSAAQRHRNTFFFVSLGFEVFSLIICSSIVFTHLSDFVMLDLFSRRRRKLMWGWQVGGCPEKLDSSVFLSQRRLRFSGFTCQRAQTPTVYSSEVLQDTVQPRVGGVFLYTNRIRFFFAGLLRF